jgi:hypothetical protein
VDADFVREVEEAGIAHPGPDELVRLRSRGFKAGDCKDKGEHDEEDEQ